MVAITQTLTPSPAPKNHFIPQPELEDGEGEITRWFVAEDARRRDMHKGRWRRVKR